MVVGPDEEALLRWHPAMGEQFADAAGGLSWQPFEDVLQIRIDVVAVEPGRMNQGHDGRSPLAGTQAAGEQPVVAADGESPFILPMSGKKWKSIIAGTRFMAVGFGYAIASSAIRNALSMLRPLPA